MVIKPTSTFGLSLIFTSISSVARPFSRGAVSYGAGTANGKPLTMSSSSRPTSSSTRCCATGTSCLSFCATTTLKSSSSCASSLSASLPSSIFSGATAARIFAASPLTIFEAPFTEASRYARAAQVSERTRSCAAPAICLSTGSALRSGARAFYGVRREGREVTRPLGHRVRAGAATIADAIRPTPGFFAALANAATGPERSASSCAPRARARGRGGPRDARRAKRGRPGRSPPKRCSRWQPWSQSVSVAVAGRGIAPAIATWVVDNEGGVELTTVNLS